MDNKYIALVLAVLVAAAEGNSVSFKNPLIPNALGADAEQKWDGLGKAAVLNEYIDNTIEMIVPFIQTHGLDPMDLPDVVEGFEVKVLLVTYSAWLKIHDGYMTGLVNVDRNGDQRVDYFAKMLRIRISLNFTNLEFIYKYLVKVMKIGPTGGIRGSLNRFVVNVDVLLDFNNDEIQLQEFSLTDIGNLVPKVQAFLRLGLEGVVKYLSSRLRVRLTGNVLTDWLVNPVITVFVSIFDNVIIKVVEINIRSAIQSAISAINANVKDVIRYIESYN